ncbi:MAG: hypothetical protein KF761_12030 [Salinibacterium sp.]|nr:hypothetical protein [Salinibacterium sp.]
MPRDAPEGHALGPDPQRVFLIGGGISVGWGVMTHHLALAGALARALTALTGRGTDVDARVGLTVGPLDAIAGLKRADLSPYAAVVVTLGTYRAFRLVSLRVWKRDFARVVAQVTASAPNAVAVFTGMPPLRSTNAANDIVDAVVNVHARRMNQITENVCREAGVEFLPLLTSPADKVVADWNSKAYKAIGELIAERLAIELSHAGSARGVDSELREDSENGDHLQR